MADLKKLLADGLSAGYAGSTAFDHITRSSFEGDQSSFVSPDGSIYLDQWFAKLRGGGQELVRNKDGQEATRLYAGGVIYPERLTALGITTEQILAQHQKFIKQLGGKTRLGEKCIPEPDGDWQYAYTVLERFPEVGLEIGLETQFFKGETVFVHGIFNTPVE